MRLHYLELLGQKHPMCFSAAAAEALDEHFSGLDKLVSALTGRQVGIRTRALDKVLSELLRAGRTYACAMGEDVPPPLPCRPAELVGAADTEVILAVLETIREDSDRRVRTQGNAEATRSG